ncbi:MAG: photosystem II S4 domain protein [Limnochordaceae bacterium]|nr:photosystem II S4 domain protein [Limnochordaceae bacterium]
MQNMEVPDWIKQLPEEQQQVAQDARNAIARCLERQEPQVSDFVEPAFRPLVEGLVRDEPSLLFRWEGGYGGAERCRLLVYPDYVAEEELPPVLAAFVARAEVGQDAPAVRHADWLGSLLATGIRRSKVGDLLLQPDGHSCQGVIVPELVDFLRTHWQRVGPWPVQVEPIDVEALQPPGQRSRELRVFVSSLRLDVVASAGFRTSRTHMAREIRAARVKLNWQGVVDPARNVKAGDVISIRGRGRLVVGETAGQSKKGRLLLVLQRFG